MNFDLLFEKAKAAGIEDLQITYSGSTEFDVEAFKGQLEKYQIADSATLKVKGIYNKKMGTVTTEVINEDVFDFLVKSVVDSAKLIDSQDEVFIYEGDKEYPVIEGLFNESLAKVDAKVKIEETLNLEKAVVSNDDRVTMVQTFYGEGTTNVLIQNSKGLKLEKLVNSAMYGAYAIATDGKDQRTGMEFQFTNEYSEFDLELLAKKAATKATALLGATPVESGEYEVLISASASHSLLAAYVSMFSAEAVQKDVSLLKGKVNELIANELITIVDDPFKLRSPKSGSFDGEGVATSFKELVKDGVLTGYMHNLKTAKKDNTKSTGNASGAGIGPSNFYIQPGTLKYDDAVKSMKKGIIITNLAGTHAGANPISGDFSLQTSGFLVEDGKIVKPVALITSAGNYLELLGNVTGVCDDLEFGFSYIGSPSLKVKSLQISGK